MNLRTAVAAGALGVAMMAAASDSAYASDRYSRSSRRGYTNYRSSPRHYSRSNFGFRVVVPLRVYDAFDYGYSDYGYGGYDYDYGYRYAPYRSYSYYDSPGYRYRYSRPYYRGRVYGGRPHVSLRIGF